LRQIEYDLLVNNCEWLLDDKKNCNMKALGHEYMMECNLNACIVFCVN